MTGVNHSAVAALATALIAESRPIIRQYFRQSPDIQRKADETPVTIADQSVETALRAKIRTAFPDHSIIGEEHGQTDNPSRYTWVIDPIDGTRAFTCGNPMFGTLIAVLYDGLPVIGVIDMPILDQTWVGITGQTTTLNGNPIAAAATTALDQARLTTTSGHALGGDYPRFMALAEQSMVTGYGGDCANYAHLASGWCDLVAESQLNAYDIMAVIPVITGGGGVITQWDGQTITLDGYDGTALASATPILHDKALAVLAA
jgi:inositol-phosphate phosphatase/L-galactose 1-phosphate phosphatase/histidinol-phosphatase